MGIWTDHFSEEFRKKVVGVTGVEKDIIKFYTSTRLEPDPELLSLINTKIKDISLFAEEDYKNRNIASDKYPANGFYNFVITGIITELKKSDNLTKKQKEARKNWHSGQLVYSLVGYNSSARQREVSVYGAMPLGNTYEAQQDAAKKKDEGEELTFKFSKVSLAGQRKFTPTKHIGITKQNLNINASEKPVPSILLTSPEENERLTQSDAPAKMVRFSGKAEEFKLPPESMQPNVNPEGYSGLPPRQPSAPRRKDSSAEEPNKPRKTEGLAPEFTAKRSLKDKRATQFLSKDSLKKDFEEGKADSPKRDFEKVTGEDSTSKGYESFSLLNQPPKAQTPTFSPKKVPSVNPVQAGLLASGMPVVVPNPLEVSIVEDYAPRPKPTREKREGYVTSPLGQLDDDGVDVSPVLPSKVVSNSKHSAPRADLLELPLQMTGTAYIPIPNPDDNKPALDLLAQSSQPAESSSSSSVSPTPPASPVQPRRAVVQAPSLKDEAILAFEGEPTFKNELSQHVWQNKKVASEYIKANYDYKMLEIQISELPANLRATKFELEKTRPTKAQDREGSYHKLEEYNTYLENAVKKISSRKRDKVSREAEKEVNDFIDGLVQKKQAAQAPAAEPQTILGSKASRNADTEARPELRKSRLSRKEQKDLDKRASKKDNLPREEKVSTLSRKEQRASKKDTLKRKEANFSEDIVISGPVAKPGQFQQMIAERDSSMPIQPGKISPEQVGKRSIQKQ